MRLAQISLGDKFKNEINLLLKINSNIMSDASDISNEILNGKLTLNQKKQLSELNKSEPFTGIVSEITSNAELWNNFYNDPYAENSIPFDSKEGLEIIDKWVDKWGYIIRSLKKKSL